VMTLASFWLVLFAGMVIFLAVEWWTTPER
jgi:hypothetical protein